MIWLLAAAALAASAAQDDTQTSLQELRQVFQDSCAQRAYGAYDDVCDQLGQQVHAAEVAADRAARRKKKANPEKAADAPISASAPPAAAPAPAPAPVEHPLGYQPPPGPHG